MIYIAGEDAHIDELVDFIVAAQIATKIVKAEDATTDADKEEDKVV